MSSEAPCIEAQGLGKAYRLYARPQDRLRQFVLPRLRRLLGRPPGRYFEEFWALRDLDLTLARGQTLGIIGRNGSGKSTLLQLLCGTLQPSAGACQVRGRVAALLELGTGFNPEFTGRENLRLNAVLLGLTPAQVAERLERIVAFADLGSFIDQPTRTYSSGMLVRLAFAVAAHVDADVLVIDEALAVGDAAFTQKCMRFLRAFRERGTLVFVSHDAGAVLSLCDTALWLQGGRRMALGPAKPVCEAYLAALHDTPSEARAPQAAARPEASRPPTGIEAPASVARPGGDPACGTPAPMQALRDAIDRSTLRNDLQVFRFSPEGPSFGDGAAVIVAASLQDGAGRRHPGHVVGGEHVALCVRVRAEQPLLAPIVGFSIKDRLGQVLFGENTFLAHRAEPLVLDAGAEFEARFAFSMPILPRGDYAIAIAVASGSQESHVQHHWIHDAIYLHSLASSVSTGLVGIPMHSITLAPTTSPLALAAETL